MRCELPTCNKCSVFEENKDVEEVKAGKSIAYCGACDRDLKRAALGLPFSEKKSIGISLAIGHVRYVNILTWLRGFRVKILYLVLFSLYPSLFWELRDKRNLKNLQFLPESLGAVLEY